MTDLSYLVKTASNPLELPSDCVWSFLVCAITHSAIRTGQYVTFYVVFGKSPDRLSQHARLIKGFNLKAASRDLFDPTWLPSCDETHLMCLRL